MDVPNSMSWPTQTAIAQGLRRSGRNTSRASSSSSSSRGSNRSLTVLPELDSIDITVDAVSDCFALQKYTVRRSSPSSQRPATATEDAFSLKNWVHPCVWSRFKDWTQEWMNAEANGGIPPADFGPLVFALPT